MKEYGMLLIAVSLFIFGLMLIAREDRILQQRRLLKQEAVQKGAPEVVRVLPK